jgi:hypothetical protein
MGHRTIKPHLLAPQDTSDIQWREFRSGLPQLAAALVAYAAAARAARSAAGARGAVATTLAVAAAFLGKRPSGR